MGDKIQTYRDIVIFGSSKTSARKLSPWALGKLKIRYMVIIVRRGLCSSKGHFRLYEIVAHIVHVLRLSSSWGDSPPPP